MDSLNQRNRPPLLAAASLAPDSSPLPLRVSQLSLLSLPQKISWKLTHFVRVKGLLLLGPSADMPPVLRPAWPTCQHSPRRLGKNLPRARLGPRQELRPIAPHPIALQEISSSPRSREPQAIVHIASLSLAA